MRSCSYHIKQVLSGLFFTQSVVVWFVETSTAMNVTHVQP